ncbi:MAG: hypothetical protein J4F49_04500 [Rhodobacteraceae bacterium]|nr:hypothetical protein [Paracoccaceae bacterium]
MHGVSYATWVAPSLMAGTAEDDSDSRQLDAITVGKLNKSRNLDHCTTNSIEEATVLVSHSRLCRTSCCGKEREFADQHVQI